MQNKKAYLSAVGIICFTVLLNSLFLTCFRVMRLHAGGEKSVFCPHLSWKHIFPVCKDGPAVIRTAMLLVSLWSQSPTEPTGVSLFLLVRIKKPLPHCFLATFFKVKPQAEFLVVADKSLEFRWKFSGTEEHFCWAKSRNEDQCEKSWYLKGRKSSCGFVGRAYHEKVQKQWRNLSDESNNGRNIFQK